MKFNLVTLEEISGGGSYGLGASASSDDSGPKFLRTTDIASGTISWEDVPFCRADSTTISKYRLFPNDIVISRTGANAGLNCLVLNPPENAIFAGYLVRFQIKKEIADAKFVSYVLRSEIWNDYVGIARTGSAQPQFNAVLMGKFPLSLPELGVQKSISSILGVIDEKISANNALSKTLEDIAQTIFKSWFIDFDPVKAKMARAKPSGMDASTAALFPDSMAESEMGLIPKSWEIAILGEVVDLSWGDTKTTKASYVTEGFLAYSAKGQDGYLNKFDYSEIGIILSAIGAGCGRTWLATGQWSCIKNTIRIIANSNYVESIPYVYILTRNANFWPKRGSAQPFIAQEDSRGLRILVPSRELLVRFSGITTPIFQQITNLALENIKLQRIRDCLLPALISGELQIPKEMLAI